jgi:hypothetical protein
LERVYQLEAMVGLAEQGSALAATVLDSLDEGARQAEANGISMEGLRGAVGSASIYLARFIQDGSLETLLQSGVLDKSASEAVGLFGKALGASRQAEPQRAGAFGLLSALKDPDLQRGVGFMVIFRWLLSC